MSTKTPSTHTINTGGAAAVGHDVRSERDFIGRDQINITIHEATPTVDPAQLPLSDLHLINFSHPLTLTQQQQIEQAVGCRMARIIEVAVEFDEAINFAPQCVAVVDRIQLSPYQWRTTPLLINPPGYAPVVVCLLSELHGRIRHFPTVLRFRPDRSGPVQRFVLEEIINLQALRDAARARG